MEFQKKYFIGLLLIFFSVHLSFSQEKCYCDLVEDYMSLAKTYFPERGEQLRTVSQGQELWIDMRPIAHRRNQGEKGGCRLRAGEYYVADRNGKPVRAWLCGNNIVDYNFYSNYPVTPNSCDDCPKNNSIVYAESRTRNDGMWSDPVPTRSLSGNLAMDTRSFPLSQEKAYHYNDCETYWREQYPAQWIAWNATRKNNSFWGPDRMSMRKCATGRTYVGRNLGWLAPSVLAVIGGGIYLATNSSGHSDSNPGYNRDITPRTPGNQ